MPRFSKTLYDANGKPIGIAGGSAPNQRCSSCKRRGATLQCDYPLTKAVGQGRGGTCDRWLCAACALHIGADLDYCPPHARMAKEAT